MKAKLLPLQCVKCHREIGPLYPVGADCAGWMCDECYAKAQAYVDQMLEER